MEASQGPVLVLFAEDDTPAIAYPVHGDRVEMRCGDGRPRFEVGDVMASWSADDCEATFRARDPNADLNSCQYEDAQPEETTDDGCAGGPATSFGLLGGAAALTWLRRSRRSALPDRTS